MGRLHSYQVSMKWTGNLGTGTSGYRAYSRNHEINGNDKIASIPGSSDPAFRGDKTRWNPEELLVSALSTCHMLAFLHLCADAGITVIDYTDEATGQMQENADGSGQLVSTVLRPKVVLEDESRAGELNALHEKAHHLCFIARSVNFPVTCEPR